jgi:hypothetical protein
VARVCVAAPASRGLPTFGQARHRRLPTARAHLRMVERGIERLDYQWLPMTNEQALVQDTPLGEYFVITTRAKRPRRREIDVV